MRAHLVAVVLFAACSSGSKSVKQTPPPPDAGAIAASPVALDALTENEAVRGFHITARYLDDAGAPTGARFVHDATGFVFDYLRIDSAPQGFVWVNTFPTSDQGEPHTQEHLLLGKGDRGRKFGNFEAMNLAESSAFTEQWRTCYHFHTIAGHDAFWGVFEDQLDDLLNPDYTDEEIRREVSNFGLSADPDGKLRLEEQGTVYNEMVRTYEQPNSLLWYEADRIVYGATHPLARSSGGFPDDIRTMSPEDIRDFHERTYYLGNMGVIGSFPPSMALGDVLDHTAAILDRLAGRTGDAMTEADLPPPAAAKPGATKIVEYPYDDATKASPMMLVWPATRDLDLGERTLLELFVSAVAGDESTNLYKKLVDTKTRAVDLGATDVWGYVRDDLGTPVYLGLSGVAVANLTTAGLDTFRTAVLDELNRIASLPAGDPELIALRDRIASRLADQRRGLAKFMSSPPRFGFRGTSASWEHHLLGLEHVAGFDKSLTLAPERAAIEALLAQDGNPWTKKLAAWGLLEQPYALANKPSPALRKKLDDDHQARLAAELARLGTAYGTTTEDATLARFQADYDAATAKLEADAKASVMPPFVDTPPMTLDDELQYDVTEVAGTKLVASKIESMTGGTVSVALRLDAVPEDELMYLALLPSLLTQTGLDEDGTITTSEQVKEALRREILSLNVYFDSNARTGRTEMVASGAGTDLAETQRALQWIARLLAHPDWRTDNLPRLRDVVDQAIQGYRNVMLGAEEGWVEDPPAVWWRQTWPLYAHTSSFLTQLHDLHRLRWMLMADATAKPAAKALQALAKPKKAKRADLVAAATKASKDKQKLVAEAGKDLLALLPGIPDDSLAADWAYLCHQMASDLLAGPKPALAHLAHVRELVVDASNARAWLVASSDHGATLRGDLETLLGTFGHASPARQTYSDAPFVTRRLQARNPKATAPLFVGLVNPNTSSGVFVNSAPGAFYADTSDEALLDYLAGNLYTGHGGHSIFMKTWAAGLAYSNGLRISLGGGRVRYYAERCPELPQTLRFVIGELQKAKVDPALVDYAIAESFSSRVAASYEERAGGIADDLEDGVTPELVEAFRTHLLALRDRRGLADDLFTRMERVYGDVLPGYGTPSAEVQDGVFFVLGPEAQLDAYDKYLAATEQAKLFRLYPRDFWVP